MHAFDLRQFLLHEAVVVVDGARRDQQNEIDIAHQHEALDHFREADDLLLELRQALPAVAGQLDVHEYQHLEAQFFASQQRDAALDDAAGLELVDPAPAGRLRQADRLGEVGGGYRRVLLQLL